MVGDKMGGQAAMILAFFSASLSYFLLGIAGTFFMLFISRLPSVFMHAMQEGPPASCVIANVVCK
jgi:OCT family organic cation transporter-like MFS transporter 18